MSKFDYEEIPAECTVEFRETIKVVRMDTRSIFTILGSMLAQAAQENREKAESIGLVFDINIALLEVLGDRLRTICTLECMGTESEFGFHIDTDPKRREFEVYLACYVSGLRVSEHAILEASYTQACCLLRQDMESLTQLIHTLGDTLKGGKSPQIGVLEEQLRRLYTPLTNITHLTAKDVLRYFIEPSFFHHPADRLTLPMLADCQPSHKEETCKLLLAVRALVMICVIGVLEKYIRLYFEHLAMDNKTRGQLENAYRLLCEEVPDVAEYPLNFDAVL